MPAPEDVAAFLGQSEDESTLSLASQALPIITAMCKAYTRDQGFKDGKPNDELEAVIITATARLMGNPEQTQYRAGNVSFQSHFQGWTLAELFVLNRYRKRALG